MKYSMKNIFIVPKGLSAGVINSQIIEMVSNLNCLYEENSAIIIHQSDRKKVSSSEEEYTSLFMYLLKSKNINYLYVRSIYDFIIAYFLKKAFLKKYRIIYDYRGLVSEESYLRNQSNLRKRIIGFIEQFIYNKADEIHTVSTNFKEYLEEKFGQKEIKVIPCAISKNIQKANRYKEHIDFVYLGSTSVWQKFEETVKLYSYIEKRLENTKLTIITLDKGVVEKIIKEYDILNCEIKSLSHQEVLKELKEYDFGFLLRNDNIVNNVASPIKFLEYVSNGVIPIVTDGIGDYSDVVRNHKIGMVLDQKLTLDIDKLNDILDDKEIYSRLKEVSSLYIWRNILKGFYSE